VSEKGFIAPPEIVPRRPSSSKYQIMSGFIPRTEANALVLSEQAAMLLERPRPLADLLLGGHK
jgi:hypothetical protein